MVQWVPAALVLAPLEHREVDDPEDVMARRRLVGHGVAQVAEHAGGHVGFVGHDQDRVALARAELGVDRTDLFLGEELGDG